AFFASLSILALFGSLRNIVTTWRKTGAIRRAEQGLAPEDGKLSAAIGRIEPDGAPFQSPLSGRPCVAYDYKIYHEDPMAAHRPERDDNFYGGLAMCPCSVHAPLGKFRLLGFPMLEHVPPQFRPTNSSRENFAKHAAQAFFEDARSMKGIWDQLSKVEDILLDDDGALRKDLRLGDDPANWQGVKFREQLVEPGEEVVVLGKYSALRGGFINESKLGTVNDLYPGKPREVMKQIRGNTIFLVLFSIAYFSFFHGILALFLWGPR
ncbi:MAG TPA: hypothetical protein VFW62_02530, partial [bacterium]|nr:hypothetical protein [bacterium]